MANTLTNLLPDLYVALDTVSREMVGLIPAVSTDMGAERVAANQTVRSFVAPAATAATISPGQYPADNGNQTFTNKTITISAQRYCPIRWSGEEQLGVNSGPGYRRMFQAQAAQAMRTLVNEIETDLAELYVKASRAVQPSGTTLFDASTTVYKDVANVRRVLVDNGAPLNDMSLVLNTLSAAALRGNPQYAGANTAGSQDALRRGVLLDLSGMAIRESAQMQTHTAGDGATVSTDDSGYAVGATTITLKSSGGTGAVLAGDTITFNGDTNIYVVTTGDADISNGGTIVLAAPGLKQAISAAETAITIVDNGQRNMAFSRNAIHLVTRAPALPEEGDMAVDRQIITDPMSGLSFEVSKYMEYRRVRYEVSIVWGAEVIKPEHLALLID